MDRLRTSLCDLLRIEYPILQSGMGGVAGPELVAEVSRAGGLGILAGLRLSADQLRTGIRRVRELTDRPFGVNLWLHTQIRPPVDPATLPDETVHHVQGVLNGFRTQLGIPPTTSRPAPVPDVIDEAFEVILEEQVPVWSIGLGNPGRDMVARCRERGVKVIAMVATVDDARAVAATGPRGSSRPRARRPRWAPWRSFPRSSTPWTCRSSPLAASPTAAASRRRSRWARSARCSGPASWRHATLQPRISGKRRSSNRAATRPP